MQREGRFNIKYGSDWKLNRREVNETEQVVKGK